MTVTIQVEQVSYRFAHNSVDTTFYLERINKYKQECGCTMGAIFMTCALITWTVRAFVVDWGNVHIVKFGLFGVLVILLSTGLGKLLGMGVARVRLKRLYRSLIKNGHLERLAQD